jgi:hypothetical protein
MIFDVLGVVLGRTDSSLFSFSFLETASREDRGEEQVKAVKPPHPTSTRHTTPIIVL